MLKEPEKLKKIIYRIVIPAVALAAVLFALLAPPSLPLGNDYVLYPVDPEKGIVVLRAHGGKELAGPGVLRIWGNYPWVYGVSDDPEHAKFFLNMEDHKFSSFPADKGEFHEYSDFDRFLNEHGFTVEQTVGWKELYQQENSGKIRKTLKDLLRYRKIN